MNNSFFTIVKLIFMMFLKFIKNTILFVNNFTIKVMRNYELISNYVLNKILASGNVNKELFVFVKVFLYITGTFFFIYIYILFSQIIKETICYFNKLHFATKCNVFKISGQKHERQFNYFASTLLNLVKSKKYNLFLVY